MATELFNQAKKNKVDEFYTQLPDIEAELHHYKEHFRGKVVFCNCDDPYESNFFKYFAMNFNFLGLKKLIATSYSDSPVAGEQLSLFDIKSLDKETIHAKQSHKIVISEVNDENADGAVDLADVEYLIKNKKNTLTFLKGNGDFRSPECIALLNEADIVVTNPPFSLFREYVKQLVEYKKAFIIIGNKNAITYKELFKLIQENKCFIGNRPMTGGMWFIVPEGNDYDKVIEGVKLKNVPSCWFTSLDVAKHHVFITLYKPYTEKEYPKYDNYDAIEVSKTADIPSDYEGAMGVPITFLDKYNPEQFEILGLTSGRNEYQAKPTKRYINPKQINTDGSISNGSKANTRATLLLSQIPKDIYYTADNADGPLQILYARIVIKRKGATQ